MEACGPSFKAKRNKGENNFMVLNRICMVLLQRLTTTKQRTKQPGSGACVH